MTTMVARRSQFHQARLGENVTAWNLHTQQALQQMTAWFISRGADPYTASKRAIAALYFEVQRHASMMSFVEAFWTLCIIFCAVVPLCFLLDNPRKRRVVPQQVDAPPTVLETHEAVGEPEHEPELAHV